MEKKFYDIRAEGFEPKKWYQKRLSPAQWQALLSHTFDVLNPMHFMNDQGQIDPNPNPLKLMALLTGVRGKLVGEYFFGTILIPDTEVFNYDQILVRGRLIMSIDDPDVFVDLVKQAWADFLLVNKKWFEKFTPVAASLSQSPTETSEISSMPSTPTSEPTGTEPGTGSSGDSAEEMSPGLNTPVTTSPSN